MGTPLFLLSPTLLDLLGKRKGVLYEKPQKRWPFPPMWRLMVTTQMLYPPLKNPNGHLLVADGVVVPQGTG